MRSLAFSQPDPPPEASHRRHSGFGASATGGQEGESYVATRFSQWKKAYVFSV